MTIQGLDAFLSGLKAAPELTRVRAARAVAVSTVSTENSVKAGAPEDTGTLKRAIHSKTLDLQGQVLIGESGYYWRFIEYGTTRAFGSQGGRSTSIAARPFIREAAEREQPQFVKRMEGVANDVSNIISSGRFL